MISLKIIVSVIFFLLSVSVVALDYDIATQPDLFLLVDSSSSIIDYDMTDNTIVVTTGTYLPETRHDEFTVYDMDHCESSYNAGMVSSLGYLSLK